jgi:Tol biopolymer transport system component
VGHQRAFLVLVLAVSSALALAKEAAAESRVDLVSRGVPSGSSDTANGASGIPAASRQVWSADGRWLVFTSTARDLVPGQLDRENTEDVFLYDRSTGSRALVSRRAGSTLTTANASSTDPVISPDGRWIAFVSQATDLMAGQVDTVVGSASDRDVFLHDRLTGATTLVSHRADSPLAAAGAASAPALSAEGAVVAFEQGGSVYFYDRPSGEITLVSHRAGSPSEPYLGHSPSVSADGRFVVFISQGHDMVLGQIDPLGAEDVFLYDRDTGITLLVSHAAGSPLAAGNGQYNFFNRNVYAAAALSADGRWVGFTNLSSNLAPEQTETSVESVDVFLWDRINDTTTLVSRSSASPVAPIGSFLIGLSSDGGWVAFGHLGFADSGDPAADASELVLFSRGTGSTVLVNQAAGSPGTAGNGLISDATLSADGRFVAFRSVATDLVAGAVDTNDAMDVFLFDRLGSGLTLLSHASGSSTTAAGSASATPRISPDGAFIAFGNPGTDLVTGAADLNGESDIFLHDRAAGTKVLVSLRDPGMQQETPNGASAAEGLSADGRFVVFTSEAVDVMPGVSDPNGAGTDVFLWDRDTGMRALVSRSASAPATTADGPSGKPAISADGRWVTFQSTATDLVAGQSDGNGVDDVFVWDRLNGAVRLVSGSGGSATMTAAGTSERPAISTDGRWISFLSTAGDLIDGQATTVAGSDAFLWDRDTAATLLVSRAGGSAAQGAGASAVAVSADGSSVGFLGTGTGVVPGQVDAAGTPDVFLFDRGTGQIELVSHSSASPTTAGNAASGDDFVLSADGSRIAFTSEATDIVPGQGDVNSGADVFLWTRGTGASLLVSRQAGAATATADRYSAHPSLSADGRLVAFESPARNLVAGQVEPNEWDFISPSQDIFLFDVAASSMTLVSHRYGVSNVTGDWTSHKARISADGLAVAFRSLARDLLSSKLESTAWNAYVFERLSGRTRLASRTPESPLAPGDFDATGDAPWIGAGRSYVAFTSLSSNLVPGDFNQSEDAFLFSDPPVAGDLFLVTPCRLFDTRRPEDGPALASGAPVLLDVDGGCGLPATARALVLNVTVVQPAGSGYLVLYPGDTLQPVASTIAFAAGGLRTNNATVSLAEDGTGTLLLYASVGGNGTVHVILDVVGYFED